MVDILMFEDSSSLRTFDSCRQSMGDARSATLHDLHYFKK